MGSRPGGISGFFAAGRASRADEFVGNQSRIDALDRCEYPSLFGIEALSIGLAAMAVVRIRCRWYDSAGRELGLKRALLTSWEL